ncbi:nuclear pore complex protein Nup93-like [Lytechinus variegatus]|uniref:nuclear pore complex protein Nup93-like n=2 Tax=Lytechinus TaxID=7652 RepID=UPI001BB18594|nr:nuclear pore complex protein Nup93-like [Lytechinus variegatus]
MDTIGGGFGDLLRDAEQLTADVDTGSELPKVEQTLHQIMETSQRLWTKTAQLGTSEAADVKASILLGSKGLDIPRISQRLETLSAAKTYEPLEPIADTDIQGLLRNERENALLAVIEETKRNTRLQTEQRLWQSKQNEWEQEKQRILNTLLGSSSELIDVSAETSNLFSDVGSRIEGRSAMDAMEMAYARQVYIYNDKVVKGGTKPNLISLFEEMSQQFEDKRIEDFWAMVREMSSVPMTTSSDSVSVRMTEDLQMAFIRQGKKFLEHSYIEYISNIIGDNLRQARLGGVPGVYQLVRGFLKVKLPTAVPGLEDGLVEGIPVWPVIYYCIRCGDLNAAMITTNNAAQSLGEFSEYLEEYMHNDDRRLSPSTETKLRLHYRRAVRNSTDPFKRAVYCLLGRCDTMDNHAEVCEKTEDYLWLKLSQVQFGESPSSSSSSSQGSSDRLTLQQLQTTLLEEYGETHFSAHQNPHLYFKILFLSAQFEAAIEFLSRHDNGLRSHAVHSAIVLHELGLLALPQNIQAQLLSRDPQDPLPMHRLNFVRLISMYTSKFESTDPREALQYFYLLRNLRDANGKSYFVRCLSELVIETREFETLLGRRERDGARRPGAVDKFQEDTQSIIETVAMDTETKGLFEDALKLHDLAGNTDKVLELMNRLLSPTIASSNSPQSNRERLQALALSIAERYQSKGLTGSPANTKSFYLLLDLMTFFDAYHNRDLDRALSTIRQLQIIALSPESVDDRVHGFKQYTDEIRRSLPDVLLATMTILYTKYRSCRSSGTQSPQARAGQRHENGGKESFLAHLRKQAKALITFAGMLPYRMPGDTNARLVQMEVLMN